MKTYVWYSYLLYLNETSLAYLIRKCWWSFASVRVVMCVEEFVDSRHKIT